jgi:hypothetical protein
VDHRPRRAAVRPTKDVDAIVEVASRSAFNDFEARLRRRLSRGQKDGVICHWRHDRTDLILDAMPSKAGILGFDNRWQGAGRRTA